MKTISLIVPCFNEEPTVELFYDTTEKVFAKLNATRDEQYKPDYLFINDGSADGTLDVMRKLNAAHPDEVHYISFSRNFGKESAFAAGSKTPTVTMWLSWTLTFKIHLNCCCRWSTS